MQRPLLACDPHCGSQGVLTVKIRAGERRGELAMELSARNQLPGTVKSVKLGTVMAEIVIDVNGMEVVSAITRSSAESLGLKVGDQVRAVVKATEVMVAK